MSWLWPILAVAILAIWTYSLIDIIRRRHSMSAGKIAAWVIIIIVFPIVGSLAYFIVHGTGGPEAAPRGPIEGPMP